jgi:hypothetical protein
LTRSSLSSAFNKPQKTPEDLNRRRRKKPGDRSRSRSSRVSHHQRIKAELRQREVVLRSQLRLPAEQLGHGYWGFVMCAFVCADAMQTPCRRHINALRGKNDTTKRAAKVTQRSLWHGSALCGIVVCLRRRPTLFEGALVLPKSRRLDAIPCHPGITQASPINVH